MHIPFRRFLPAVLCWIFLSACDSSTTAPEPAPNLTGIWVGTLTHGTDSYSDEWTARLDLTEFDGNADGYLVGELRTSAGDRYLIMSVTGEVSGADVVLLDGTLRGSRQPSGGFSWCNDREFEMEYRVVQGRERLVGEWTMSSGGCSGGRITLER